MNQIQATNYITFISDEINLAGMGHTKALHISLKCKGYIVAKVFIDNGPALNVLPMTTLYQLSMDKYFMKLNHIIIRAFDEAASDVVRDIDIKLEIGTHVFNVLL